MGAGGPAERGQHQVVRAGEEQYGLRELPTLQLRGRSPVQVRDPILPPGGKERGKRREKRERKRERKQEREEREKKREEREREREKGEVRWKANGSAIYNAE